MSNAAMAIRLRRRRKRPARLVFLAIDYALCIGFVTFWLVAAITNGEWRLAGSGLAAVWTMFAVGTSRDFTRTFTAWRRGDPCRPVSRVEWAILIWQLLGVFIIVSGLAN